MHFTGVFRNSVTKIADGSELVSSAIRIPDRLCSHTNQYHIAKYANVIGLKFPNLIQKAYWTQEIN